jgi:hypothetical protein
VTARLAGIADDQEITRFIDATKESSEIRKIVLEVTRPIHGTRRIINTDNYYTSVQLLEALKQVNLYGRGTTRENSKHFFRGIHISSKDGFERGAFRQAVSRENKLVVASWVDGSIVNIVSNADESKCATLQRRIKKNMVSHFHLLLKVRFFNFFYYFLRWNLKHQSAFSNITNICKEWIDWISSEQGFLCLMDTRSKNGT